MSEHELKIRSEYFARILDGSKTFEMRRDDRPFEVGDTLRLREWLPDTEEYTGRDVRVGVSYLMRDSGFIVEGFVCLGLVNPRVAELEGERAQMMTDINVQSVRMGGLQAQLERERDEDPEHQAIVRILGEVRETLGCDDMAHPAREVQRLKAQLERANGVYRMLGFDETIPEKCAAALMDRLTRATEPRVDGDPRETWKDLHRLRRRVLSAAASMGLGHKALVKQGAETATTEMVVECERLQIAIRTKFEVLGELVICDEHPKPKPPEPRPMSEAPRDVPVTMTIRATYDAEQFAWVDDSGHIVRQHNTHRWLPTSSGGEES